MNQRRIVVVSAGLGQPSSTRLLADRLAQASREVAGGGGVTLEVEIVELRDVAHDLTDHLLTGFPSPRLREVLDLVVAADGVIAVSPIFSASYNGLFKTFFDVLEEGAVAGKPVLLAATAGTARHSLALEHALRPLFAYLKALVVPTSVFAAAEDFGSAASNSRSDAPNGRSGTPDGPLGDRIRRAAAELVELLASREPRRVVDPFDELTPFEELLRAG